MFWRLWTPHDGLFWTSGNANLTEKGNRRHIGPHEPFTPSPMTARATLEHGGMIVQVEGDYSPEEVRHAVVGGLFSQEFQLPGAVLFDSREASAVPTVELLDESVKLLRALFQHGIASRCAVIAARERVALARDIQTLIRKTGGELDILTTMEEGKKWLRESGSGPLI